MGRNRQPGEIEGGPTELRRGRGGGQAGPTPSVPCQYLPPSPAFFRRRCTCSDRVPLAVAATCLGGLARAATSPRQLQAGSEPLLRLPRLSLPTGPAAPAAAPTAWCRRRGRVGSASATGLRAAPSPPSASLGREGGRKDPALFGAAPVPMATAWHCSLRLLQSRATRRPPSLSPPPRPGHAAFPAPLRESPDCHSEASLAWREAGGRAGRGSCLRSSARPYGKRLGSFCRQQRRRSVRVAWKLRP